LLQGCAQFTTLRLFFLSGTARIVHFASKGHSSLLKAEPKKILLALSCFAPFWFVEKKAHKGCGV
jgi:hypothetical protein